MVKSEREEIHVFAQNKGLYTKSEFISEEKDKKNMILSKIPFTSPDDNFNIIEFCNYHYNEISKTQKNKIKALEELFKFLGSQDYDTKIVKCKTISNPIFVVSYCDWNKSWKKAWNRQTRGTVLMLNYETDKIELLRLSLERNTEVLTGMQDLTVSKESLDLQLEESDYDERQKFVIKCIHEDTKYTDAYLAGKTDGSLCTVNIFRKNKKVLGKKLNECVPCCGEIINQLCNNNDFVFTLSTKEVFLITDESMYKNIFTALLCGSAIVSYEELKNDVFLSPKEKRLSLDQVLRKYLPEYIRHLEMFLETYCSKNNSEIIIMNNEMVIPYSKTSNDLRDAWNNKASSPGGMVYDVPLFNFLGTTFINDDNFYFVSHFEFKQNIFHEPYYWKIETQNQLDDMLKHLSLVIRKKITAKDYVQIYKPCNYYGKNDTMSPPFDFEGFIFSVALQGNLISKHKKYEASKVKTEEYYIVHKPKYGDIKYLDELFETSAEYFPDAEKKINKIKNMIPKVQPYLDNMHIFIEIIKKNYPIIIEVIASTPPFKKVDLKKLGKWEIILDYWFSVFNDPEIKNVVSENKGKRHILVEKIVDIVSLFVDKKN